MKKKKAGRFLAVLLLGIVVIVAVGWVFPKLEKEAPEVTFSGLTPALGISSEFSVTVSDRKSGVKSVSVTLLADGQDHALADYSDPGPRGRAVKSKQFDISLTPKKMGIRDGKALLRVLARDCSWRGFLKGNRTYLERELLIDTVRPEVEVLSRQHYINQGGAGLVIYRVFEAGTEHGVQMGEKFFPGYSGQFKDENICLALFAVAHDQPAGVIPMVRVSDAAGNVTRSGFYHLIKTRTFPEDRIVISDSFLKTVMPAFDIPQAGDSLIDRFQVVNGDLRRENDEAIYALCRKSDALQHWQGVFASFPNAAKRAGFGDRRSYEYQGRFVSRAVHLGVDLASLANSPVPAGNAGCVIFSGDMGIYGRTVILDHGLGLFSLYGHLSHIGVTAGQLVEKGEIIGRSGMTGLAGGDHLHYSMLVHNTFVNPIEWWDASWITNNITGKMDMVRQALAGD